MTSVSIFNIKLHVKDSASEYLVSDKRHQNAGELTFFLGEGETSVIPGLEYETRLLYLCAFNVFLTVTKWAGGEKEE